MRLLFTAVPSYGHVLPLVPLMEAAREQGHDVVLATAAGFADVVARELPPGVEHLVAGLMPHELVAEASRRTGTDAMSPGPQVAGEMFGAVLLDTAAGPVLAAARLRPPDVVVSDVYDTVGPLAAAMLGIPHHVVGLVSEVPDVTAREIARSVEPYYRSQGLAPTRPTSRLDPRPPMLGGRPSDDDVPVHPLRPRAHRGPVGGARVSRPSFSDPSRSTALVTLGTVFSDPDALAKIIDEVSAVGANVVATSGFSLRGEVVREVPERRRSTSEVHTVDFAPLDDLLEGTSVVVGGGGSGTILGALCHGVPMVLWPQGADQPRNADRAAEAGVATIVTSPSEIGATVGRVLAEPTHARRAATAAAQIAEMPDAHDVLRRIVLAGT